MSQPRACALPTITCAPAWHVSVSDSEPLRSPHGKRSFQGASGTVARWRLLAQHSSKVGSECTTRKSHLRVSKHSGAACADPASNPRATPDRENTPRDRAGTLGRDCGLGASQPEYSLIPCGPTTTASSNLETDIPMEICGGRFKKHPRVSRESRKPLPWRRLFSLFQIVKKAALRSLAYGFERRGLGRLIDLPTG